MSAATLTIEERAHLVEAEHRDSTRGAEVHGLSTDVQYWTLFAIKNRTPK